MWLRSEVDESKPYQVALCQEPSGRRIFRLVAVGSPAPADAVFLTEVVPTALLLQRNFHGIARAVRTTTGEPFQVEAHGVWFSSAESRALDEDVEWAKVPWVNGRAPLLPPM